jgi:hypothetical protein
VARFDPFLDAETRFNFDETVEIGGGSDLDQIIQIVTQQQGAPQDILDQITLPDITATANDLGLPPQANSFRVRATGGAQTITGFANVRAGRLVRILNYGANNIILANQNAGSAVQNRIITGTGGNITIQPDRGAILDYDGDATTGLRWRLLAFT